MENHWNARGQAFFQLQQRLKHFSIGQVVNSFTDHTEIGDNNDNDDSV
jgi:hypothetical protein